ncbi:serine protease snake-like [Teleopsis dalmanni]|uniref:serine protease snake-like n=2 Tax=Teleopsis dalmanni TaxID=139649 RepID=UPI0018CF495D|nr:serine protease snake-like [Teleopsis dalmanni]
MLQSKMCDYRLSMIGTKFCKFLGAIILILIILQSTVNAKRHHHRNRHHEDNQFQLGSIQPTVSVDAYGNCYSFNNPLRGRCLRFIDCGTAVWSWEQHRIPPVTCYSTTFEHFVCCPDYNPPPFWPQQPPPQIPIPQQPPIIHYPPKQNYQDQNNGITRRNQENNPYTRISEQECFKMYEERGHRNRKHRFRRELNNEGPISEDDQMKKMDFARTQAVGGVATYISEFPYMCAVGWKSFDPTHRKSYNYNCGCVLIAPKFVLTAAHCATLGGEPPNIIRLGGINLDERHAEMVKIKEITQHPDYDNNMSYNDIAIFKLERSSREVPACLWSTPTLPQQTLIAMGYGQTKFAGPSSNTLLKVFLSVLTNDNCNNYYKKEEKLPRGVTTGQICAGDPQGIMDTCQGDSGGPLLMKLPNYNNIVPYIVGLTSFGSGCAAGTPGVYTRISTYIDWIEDIVWK